MTFRATIEGKIMASLPDQGSSPAASPVLSNAEFADRLASLAQLLSAQKENPYKVKAYQRAAARIRNLSESFGIKNDPRPHNEKPVGVHDSIIFAMVQA
jgi:hypothetical protein